MRDKVSKLVESCKMNFNKLPLFNKKTSEILKEYSLRHKEALRRGEFYRRNSKDRFGYQ